MDQLKSVPWLVDLERFFCIHIVYCICIFICIYNMAVQGIITCIYVCNITAICKAWILVYAYYYIYIHMYVILCIHQYVMFSHIINTHTYNIHVYICMCIYTYMSIHYRSTTLNQLKRLPTTTHPPSRNLHYYRPSHQEKCLLLSIFAFSLIKKKL